MKSYREYCQLREGFDTISDFLLNPEHRNKTWQELFAEFEASGGKRLGNGKQGEVFYHPGWPYVLKTFRNDPFYLRFARYAYKNPHPGFPKFFGPPQQIVPFFRRSKAMTTMYIARMELLQPFNNAALFQEISHNEHIAIQYFHALKNGTADQKVPKRSYTGWEMPPEDQMESPWLRLFEMFERHPETKPLMEAMYVLNTSGLEGATDLHEGNIMKRKDGTLVFVDPLWAGSNPYMDAMRAAAMERDDYGDDEPEPQNVVGGRYPKRVRVKKPKPQSQSNWDQIPF